MYSSTRCDSLMPLIYLSSNMSSLAIRISSLFMHRIIKRLDNILCKDPRFDRAEDNPFHPTDVRGQTTKAGTGKEQKPKKSHRSRPSRHDMHTNYYTK
jgi:hypothetical protein